MKNIIILIFMISSLFSAMVFEEEKNSNYEYGLYNHITVSLIGGRYLSIKEKGTSTELQLLPIIDFLEKDKAYGDNTNIFNNKLYLPNDKVYEIKVQKDVSFPFLKLFAKVPDSEGNVEVINYENIQSSEDADTIGTFYVGVGNTDKSMKRDDAEDYTTDYTEKLPMAIDAPKSLNGVVLVNSVKLSWVNTANPNLKHVVIVRKEGSKPESSIDGTVLYTGTELEYLDDAVDSNKEYYYSAFSVASDDTISSSIDVVVDTRNIK